MSLLRGATYGRHIAAAALLMVASPLIQGASGFRDGLDMRLLATHNRERAELGVPPLKWDPRLARDAASWAGELARRGDFSHAPDGPGEPQGENLWAGTRGAFAPGLWIDEKHNFKPGVFPAVARNGQWEEVGHYSQLVWRSTGTVGCALAGGRGEDVLVCRYSAAGNIRGQRPF
jgi:hypothetical protein